MICNKKKILTFSFDDGNVDDIRLVEIFNRYGLKGTFNLNSAKLTNHPVLWRFQDKKDVRHINYTDHPDLYNGHEVACHGYTHLHFEELDYNTAYNEVFLDKKLLKALYGYDMLGMAYPYGTFDEQIKGILKELGITYCRTIRSTYNFELPKDLLELNPTCHCKYEKINALADEFINSNPTELQMFYIWGHSYEFVGEEDWVAFEELCKKLSGRDDIIYCTNIEAINLMK